MPDRKFNDKGKIYANDTQSVLRINPLQDTNSQSFPRLGRYFLSMVYVMYNEGAKKFTMWEANPTSTTDLVAINSKGDEVKSSFCSGESTSTPTAGAGSKGPPKPEESQGSESGDAKSKSLSKAAIGGIAAGAAVVL